MHIAITGCSSEHWLQRLALCSQALKALLDQEQSADGRETLLMTVATAGCATTSSSAQLLMLATLCASLIAQDNSTRSAAADLLDSASGPLLIHLFCCL